jgi:hypothetical protein
VIKLTNAVQTVPVQVETHGRVLDGMRELAAAKANSLFRFASEQFSRPALGDGDTGLRCLTTVI